jgi:hypothetical protein
VLRTAIEETPRLLYQIMHEILKPYFNEYALSNNVLQEGCDKAKEELFGNPEENIQYIYSCAKAIEEMGRTVDLIFTNRCKTMKTVNALILKEEMDRKKADKQSMTRQEKVEYVNDWKNENKIFLCDALGLEDGPQYKFLMGIFISPSTSKKQVPFLQEVLQADAAHMSFRKYTLYSVYATTDNGTMSALGFAMFFGNKDKESWTRFGSSSRRHTQLLTSPILQSSSTRTSVLLRQWKTLSLWWGGSSVAFIADKTLSRNVVAERVTKQSQLFGCTISSVVASQLPHFQPPEKGPG